jgi:hypothetical protein
LAEIYEAIDDGDDVVDAEDEWVENTGAAELQASV